MAHLQQPNRGLQGEKRKWQKCGQIKVIQCLHGHLFFVIICHHLLISNYSKKAFAVVVVVIVVVVQVQAPCIVTLNIYSLKVIVERIRQNGALKMAQTVVLVVW